jgi:hypothetical protein
LRTAGECSLWTCNYNNGVDVGFSRGLSRAEVRSQFFMSHGLSPFGDLAEKPGFKAFAYAEPNALKRGRSHRMPEVFAPTILLILFRAPEFGGPPLMPFCMSSFRRRRGDRKCLGGAGLTALKANCAPGAARMKMVIRGFPGSGLALRGCNGTV